MIASRLLASVCALGLFATTAPAGADQQPDEYYGQPVTEIRFEVDGRPDALPDLLRVVDVRVGALLTREAVRTSMDHLFALGRFDDVRPVVTSAAAGVSVLFRLVPRYPINQVEIAPGDTGVSPGLLRDELRQRFTGVVTGVRLEAVEDATRRFLNDAGYLDADASAATEVEPDAGRATLVVTVRAGPLAAIVKSEVHGASPLSASDVLRRAETLPGQPFRRREIETRLTEIEDDLRARGYYEAQAALESTPAAGGVDVVVVVEAGPRVEVRVAPENALPGRLDDLIPIRRERSADLDLLEDAKSAIERALRKDGYVAASVSFSRNLSPDGSLLQIVFTVNRGQRYYIDRIDLPAEMALPPARVRDLIAVGPGDVFDSERFEAGIAKVVDQYRRGGYYQVEAKPEREVIAERATPVQAWVALAPNITEGPRGRITEVSLAFEGAHTVPEVDVRTLLRSRVGAPYVALDAAIDHQAITTLYRERGYLGATVSRETKLSNNGADVALVFSINEGPQVIVGRVTVIGNVRVSEPQILEVAELVAGQPLGASLLGAAQRRLNDMGVFRRVSISTEDRLSGETEAHVMIVVTEAPTVTAGFGGGLEGGKRLRTVAEGVYEDHLELAPRGFFEISRRNIGGRNRSVSFFSRVSLKPRSTPDNPETDGRGYGLAEYRVTLTYLERRAFRSDTDVLVSATTEQAVRPTYSYQRRGFSAEFLRKLTPHVSVSGRYGLDFTHLFDERIDEEDQPVIDRLFPQVRLSGVSSGVSWDGRDNPLASTRGTFLSVDGGVAARALGSEVGYVKSLFQALTFRQLESTRRTVLALRGQVGLARGFPRTVTATDELGKTTINTVQDLPVSQRFFAGGGTTVRGFPEDRLGVFDPQCPPCSVIDAATGLSIGGNGVIILNAEVRRFVAKKVAVVGFMDGGNVFVRASDMDLSKIRGTVGFGTRYDSPLGPLRLDFGFKLERLVVAGRRESGWEYHLSIGEAF